MLGLKYINENTEKVYFRSVRVKKCTIINKSEQNVNCYSAKLYVWETFDKTSLVNLGFIRIKKKKMCES